MVDFVVVVVVVMAQDGVWTTILIKKIDRNIQVLTCSLRVAFFLSCLLGWSVPLGPTMLGMVPLLYDY